MATANFMTMCAAWARPAALTAWHALPARPALKRNRLQAKGRVLRVNPSVVAPNHLNRAFKMEAPDQAWVTDITYIKTHEGWLYLAVVIDLYSRRIIGWSMQSRTHMDLVLSALLMAVWRRNRRDSDYSFRSRQPVYEP